MLTLRSQNKPDAADEKRIKQLDAEIASLTKDANKLRAKSSGINEEIKELQNKILEVGGVKLRAVQSKFMTTKGLLDLANESITRAEVGQAKAQHDVEKMQKAIKVNTAKIEEVESELGTVEDDLQALTNDLSTLRQSVEEAQDSSIDVKEQLAESKAKRDEKSSELNAFRKLKMDLQQKIDDNVRAQKDSQDKYKHWAKRHEELELAYIECVLCAQGSKTDKTARRTRTRMMTRPMARRATLRTRVTASRRVTLRRATTTPRVTQRPAPRSPRRHAMTTLSSSSTAPTSCALSTRMSSTARSPSWKVGETSAPFTNACRGDCQSQAQPQRSPRVSPSRGRVPGPRTRHGGRHLAPRLGQAAVR